MPYDFDVILSEVGEGETFERSTKGLVKEKEVCVKQDGFGFLEVADVSSRLVRLMVQDARYSNHEVDCVVSNLPFDRFVKVEAGSVDRILQQMKLKAKRFVFFSGKPLRGTLESLGYTVTMEASVCFRNKRYLTIATR